jgi:hypothetical protein
MATLSASTCSVRATLTKTGHAAVDQTHSGRQEDQYLNLNQRTLLTFRRYQYGMAANHSQIRSAQSLTLHAQSVNLEHCTMTSYV